MELTVLFDLHMHKSQFFPHSPLTASTRNPLTTSKRKNYCCGYNTKFHSLMLICRTLVRFLLHNFDVNFKRQNYFIHKIVRIFGLEAGRRGCAHRGLFVIFATNRLSYKHILSSLLASVRSTEMFLCAIVLFIKYSVNFTHMPTLPCNLSCLVQSC